MTGDWGKHGSAARHDLYTKRVQSLKRCCRCPKGARKRVTHTVCANGLALAQGCEWHAHTIMRDWLRRRRAGKLRQET